MKNIHVLPTDKPSRLQLFDGINEFEFELCSKDSFFNKGVHIYITYDEEIKDREYGICLNLVREGFKSHQAVFKMDAEQRQAMEELGGQKKAEVLKVILTTDQDLIKDGVQAIDDEFLEWFVKNPSCEFAHLGFKSIIGDSETKRTYKIIIPKDEALYDYGWCKGNIVLPKEEPKTTGNIEVDYAVAQSKAIQKSMQEDAEIACKSLQKQETLRYICPTTKKQCDDECCVSAEDCHIEAGFGIVSDCELPKQETLEEAAMNYLDRTYNLSYERTTWQKLHEKTFIAGAKWQQEQNKNLYSEEEVLDHLNHLLFMRSSEIDLFTDDDNKITIKWFEQFKKK